MFHIAINFLACDHFSYGVVSNSRSKTNGPYFLAGDTGGDFLSGAIAHGTDV
jgi:hypothetical protein